MMTATTLEMLGEVVAVSRKRGLDPKSFIDVMTSTMFGGRVHKIYGDKIVRQSYEAGFVIPLVLKDVRLALAEAETAGAPMPSVDVVRDRLITGIARGYADLDWTRAWADRRGGSGTRCRALKAMRDRPSRAQPLTLKGEGDHGPSS